jgi:hypothetical protein
MRPIPHVTDLNLRQGENGVKSPDEEKERIDDLLTQLSGYKRTVESQRKVIDDLRTKLDVTEKKLSNLELKTRGRPWNA